MRRAFISAAFVLLVTAMSGPVFASAVAEEGGGSPIHLVIGTLGKAPGLDQFPLPSTTFRLNDRIYFFTEVTWAPALGAPGVHHLQYQWFTAGAPVFSFAEDKEFKTAPMSWSAYMVGTHVGLGHHRAELWIDDQLLDTHEFDIVPDTTAVTTNVELCQFQLTSAFPPTNCNPRGWRCSCAEGLQVIDSGSIGDYRLDQGSGRAGQ